MQQALDKPFSCDLPVFKHKFLAYKLTTYSFSKNRYQILSVPLKSCRALAHSSSSLKLASLLDLHMFSILSPQKSLGTLYIKHSMQQRMKLLPQMKVSQPEEHMCFP